jgi:hypothetical protein
MACSFNQIPAARDIDRPAVVKQPIEDGRSDHVPLEVTQLRRLLVYQTAYGSDKWGLTSRFACPYVLVKKKEMDNFQGTVWPLEANEGSFRHHLIISTFFEKGFFSSAFTGLLPL